MNETVKTIKGHDIYRAIGTRGFYYVDIKKTEKTKTFVVFKTIKAAAEFINNNF